MKESIPRKKMTSRELQAAERREQLLQAAKSLFATQGYHATSTRSITQEIGMADGLIYHYFPGGKLEMLHTIIREGHESRMALMDEVRAGLSDDMTIREALQKFGITLLRNLLSDPNLMRLHLVERSLLNEEETHYFANSIRERWSWLSQFLQKRAERGEVRQMDFDLAARQFVSMIGFTAVQVLMGLDSGRQTDPEQETEQLIEFTIDQWLHGSFK